MARPWSFRSAAEEQSAVSAPGCGRPGPAYDRLEERRFEFVPLWGILVFLAYRMRRVDCKRCGVTVEMVPWCDGKNQLTTTYRWFLASWAKRLSWSEVASIFRTSWDSVCRAVEHAVEWGLAHRDLSELTALGIDEIAWGRGHTYLTLVYDIGGEDEAAVGRGRGADGGEPAFVPGGSGRAGLPGRCKYVCSDMWKPYLKVIAEKLGQAIHVLDRFHVMQQFGKALDEIRAEEAKRLERDGYEPVLKKSRWCFLKRPENLTDKQTVKLSEILKYNLRTVRAYLLREEFQRFWEYKSAAWAGKFLDEWTGRVMRSRLEPMKKVARTHPDSPAADPELVPGPWRGLVGGRGGAQQQGETGDEKVVRFPDGESGETGSSTQSRPPSRAETHPQRLSASLALDRGQTLCEQDDVGRGLLWLGRSLEIADLIDDAELRARAGNPWIPGPARSTPSAICSLRRRTSRRSP